MGGARTELTRTFINPLYDVEKALFIPVSESRLKGLLAEQRQPSVQKELADLAPVG